MRFAIAYYKKDLAGTNIINNIKKLAFTPQIPVIELKKQAIYSEDLNPKNYSQLKNIDFIVFATKHESIKKQPSLSLHAPGNWRNADLGGQSGKINLTSAFILKYLFQQLNKITNQDNEIFKKYSITLEVTHHGPLIELPCCFIEIGSSEREWNDEKAGKIIAKTIISLQNYSSAHALKWTPSIAIGGPHYAPIFNQIQLNTNYAISHIIPQYSLPLTQSMLIQAEQKTQEQIKEILIDWKGCGKSGQRQQAINQIKEYGLKYTVTKEIEK